jgi:MtN3 and saliva related transmembrane protein
MASPQSNHFCGKGVTATPGGVSRGLPLPHLRSSAKNATRNSAKVQNNALSNTSVETDYITLLGITAGVLTTIAYLPQLIKTWQSKSAGDISWSMLIILCIGIILWLAYGVLVHDLPILLANIVTFILASVILVLKIRYRNQ